MKKNKIHEPKFRYVKKLLLTMKICLFLLLISAATVTANIGYSQNTKLSLNLRDATLQELIKEIESQSEFIFVFYDNAIDLQQKINISVENQSVEKILDKVLESTGNTYAVFDRQIVIGKKNPINGNISEPNQINSQVEQMKTLKGKVTDAKGEPIPGITVIVKGTTVGTITNNDGEFKLDVPLDSKVLSFSFVGMISQELIIAGKTTFNVVMAEDVVGLEDVVVVGYGTQNKVTITGSISAVSGGELSKSPSQGVANTLAGRVTGVVTTQKSGQPGNSDPQIYIRGIGTYTGASGALYLVDGVERDFQSIDPNEIESISILKDASATAVFGIRGANGVIIVTTKRGQVGAPKISFSANYGIQTPNELAKTADSYVYATEWNKAELRDNPNLTPDQVKFSPLAINSFKTGKYPTIFKNANYMTSAYLDWAPQNQENINISGGTQNVKYFVSLGHFSQDGLWSTFNDPDTYPMLYKRFNYRANVDVDLTKSTIISLTFGGLNGYRQKDMPGDIYRNVPFADIVVDGKRYRDFQNLYIPGGKLNVLDALGFQMGYTGYNTNTNNLDIGIQQKLDMVTKGLVWKFKVANNSTWNRTISRSKSHADYETVFRTSVDPTALGDSTVVIAKYGTDGALNYSESSGKSRNYYMETSFRYDRTFGNHDVGALLLYNQSQNPYPGSFQDIPTGYVGIAARGEYNYKQKYLVDVNLGYNGSENFAPGKRFGFFPSVAAGWIVTEESFMKDKGSLLNFLKLRASYGSVGNDGGIGRFLYLPDSYNLAQAPGYNFGTTISVNQLVSSEAKLGNPDLTWEKAVKQNYGLDATLLQNRLSMAVDIFFERRSNILTTRKTVSGLLALNMPAVNLGKVQNRGFEVELRWRDKIGNVNYNIGGNTSFARNKILFMDEIPQPYPYLYRTGQSVGRIWGYRFDGFWTEGDVARYQEFPDASYVPRPGDVRYKDLNNDGKINDFDQEPIGYPDYPEIIYSLSGGADYKGFDISFLANGAGRVSRTYSTQFRYPFGGVFDGALMQRWVDKQWTPETAATAELPRISFTGKSNNSDKNSDLWTYDASYWRLKNVEIGYRFSPGSLKRWGMSSVRVYASGYNLLTLTKVKYLDPEQGNGSSYPLVKIFNLGLNVTFK